MTFRILPGIGEIVADYDGLILDVWGVLHDGAKPFPFVLDTLQRLRAAKKRVVVLSNAPRRAEPVSIRLGEIGVPRTLYDHILTSGEETWQHLKRRDDPFYAALGPACYLIGPQRDSDMLDELGFTRVETVETADFILNTGPWGWDENVLRYETMLQAARARALPMVCANPDLIVAHLGRVAICAGSIAQRYEALGGSVRWHGKPFPSVYQSCFELLDVPDRKRILAIGDSLRTDIAGANAAGIDSIVVAGGIHAEEFGIAEGATPDPRRVAAAIEASGHRPIAAMAQLRW